MSTFKSIARLALAVVFGAGGVLAAHTAFDGREMPLPDTLLRTTFGGEPTTNGKCFQAQQCTGYACEYEPKADLCLACAPNPFSKCVPSEFETDDCVDQYGINGNEQYCGNGWSGDPTITGSCLNRCNFLVAYKICGEEIPISIQQGYSVCK